jgi:hypothetical protein
MVIQAKHFSRLNDCLDPHSMILNLSFLTARPIAKISGITIAKTFEAGQPKMT